MRVIRINNKNYIYNPISGMLFQQQKTTENKHIHIGYLRFDSTNDSKYIDYIPTNEEALKIKIKHGY